MPLLPVEQIQELVPPFRGDFGGKVAEALRKALSIARISDVYDSISQYQGADFAGMTLKGFDTTYQLAGEENLLNLPEGPFITISNHPYGGLDGIILIDLIGHLRKGFKVMVNEVLALVEALRPSLIVVNPKTDASAGVTRKNIDGVREALKTLKDGNPVGFFPSGAVSDLSLKERRIRDREWQPSVIRIIQKAKVPVVPIRYFDHNTMLFYLLGLIDWKIRISRLPRELVNKSKSLIRVAVGKPISPDEQARHSSLDELGKFLRDSVYDMPMPKKFISYEDFVARTR